METLGRFEKDVSELFNLTSRYGLYNITYGTKFKKYYMILVRMSQMLQF